MRTKVVRMLALALMVGGVSIVVGQQPGPGDKAGGLPSPGVTKKHKKGATQENPNVGQKAAPAKSKLEEMLAEAIKNNPDIRVAAAKLAEADAELNRARLQVMQKVVTLYHAIETQKRTVARWESDAKRLNEEAKRGIIDHTVLAETDHQLALAKGKLEELESQLPALLGKPARAEIDARVLEVYRVRELSDQLFRLDSPTIVRRESLISLAEWEKRHKATGPMSERLRKALQTSVTVDYKDMTFAAILKGLSKKVPGLAFRHPTSSPDALKMSLQFEEALPVSAILQALADESGYSFFVREYGILVTLPHEAPPGAMKVEEFLRQKPADESRHASSSGKNPPAESVEAVIKSVGKDADGLLTISIGSDAGLAKGQTLELYWMPHKAPINDARSFGTVRIVEVDAHQAVAQPVGGLKRKPQPGDRIIAQIQKK